jgi:hypothetical protein
VKELLEEVKVSELSIGPKIFALQFEKKKLENETIELSSKLRIRRGL